MHRLNDRLLGRCYAVSRVITFMHLVDAFIISDLHIIQVTVFTFDQLLLSLGIEPMILSLLALLELQERRVFLGCCYAVAGVFGMVPTRVLPGCYYAVVCMVGM